MVLDAVWDVKEKQTYRNIKNHILKASVADPF